MPDDARLGVAVDVGLPLPARRVRVARPDVFGLQALEFLLGAELVGLERGGEEGKVSHCVQDSQGSGSQVQTLGARNGHTMVMGLRKVLVEMMVNLYSGGRRELRPGCYYREWRPGRFILLDVCIYYLLWARIRLAFITHQSSGSTSCLL